MPQNRQEISRTGQVVSGVAAAALVVALWAVSGCQPSQYREKADETAYDIIEHAQEEAIGHTEPFTIETPADTLRRRLVGVQGLPIVGPESLGTDLLTPIEHWPEEEYPARLADVDGVVPLWDPQEPLQLSLVEALQVAARNSREYQSRKENVYRTALDLDLEALAFRTTYFGIIEGLITSDQRVGSTETSLLGSASLEARRRLEAGAILTGRLGLDLTKLLTSDGRASLGIIADASVTVPLLRGAGRHIVREPLTQAERDMLYAIWDFEQFKRSFAVQVAQGYYQTLQREDQVDNAADNYRRLIITARRQQALAREGELSQVELDQALQDELEARTSWIAAIQQRQTALDNFKFTLGLPTDSHVVLDRDELERLTAQAEESLGDASEAQADVQATLVDQVDVPNLEDLAEELSPQPRIEDLPSPAEPDQPPLIAADAPVELVEPSPEGVGPYELAEEVAVPLALEHRLDLRTELGQVYDAQRQVVIAANALQAGFNLVANAQTGGGQYRLTSAGETVPFRFDRGVYSAGFELDLPLERTAERNIYRDSYIRLEQAVRDVQQLEDQIKLDIRSGLRELRRAREDYVIQSRSLILAERRVDMTNMLQEYGRATTRDVLEAQAALLRAQNALTDAVVSYRLTELELQRDMDVLLVDETGLWSEFEVASLETEGQNDDE